MLFVVPVMLISRQLSWPEVFQFLSLAAGGWRSSDDLQNYYCTHEGPFLGIAPTHRKIHFESVDVMRVQNGKITDHWGVGNLLS
jgi:predicted ester cyclase